MTENTVATEMANRLLRAAIGSAVLTNKNGVTGALVTPIQIMMVAGAGYVPYMYGETFIPLA